MVINISFLNFSLIFRGYITIYDSAGFLGLYVFYILVVVIGRIINQRIRKKNASNIDQQPILDDENVGDEDERRSTDNCTLAAQENTRNSPTKSQGQESISVITINPKSLKVEESSANQTNQQNNFPEKVQETNVNYQFLFILIAIGLVILPKACILPIKDHESPESGAYIKCQVS